jgi:hypothetical protein
MFSTAWKLAPENIGIGGVVRLRYINSPLWLIKVEPHKGGPISLKPHGCLLPPLGARMAALRIVPCVSPDTGCSLKWRIALWLWMASNCDRALIDLDQTTIF